MGVRRVQSVIVFSWILCACLETNAIGLWRDMVNICLSKDITYPSLGADLGSKGEVYFNSTRFEKYGNSKLNTDACITRFTLKSNCAVNLTLTENNFRGCHEVFKRKITQTQSSICDDSCTYLFAYDPNYLNGTIRYYFSEDSWKYQAISRQTNLGLCRSIYDQSVGLVNFRMRYLVTEKLHVVAGSSQDTISPRTIRSVNFPNGYVKNDDVYTFKIQSRNQDDFVNIVFDDWDLDLSSVIEFDGANIEHVDGSSNRPVVTSTRNILQFRFYTGTVYGVQQTRHMGFKFTYTFTSSRDTGPSTDCGSYNLDETGGVLEFSGPDNLYRPVEYDCVWVVKRQPQYSKLFLKLVQSTNYRSSEWSTPNRYQIHSGVSSDTSFFRSFPPESNDVAKLGLKSDDAFYIRLRGSFYQEDKFKMAFASFDTLPDGASRCTHGLFTCSNRRCIDHQLECDGTDHCGDNSDETNCPSSEGWSPGHTPFSLSISIIIPIVVAMFLVIVICLFVVFLRRCQQSQRRSQNRNSSQVPTVSGRMARGRRTRRSQIRVTIQQEYEDSPPTYEEAITTPPNLGYFNMAFMWSQPDMPTGLMSPPPYSEVIGGPEDSTEESPRYQSEDDPNGQLPATDSLQSNRSRERREAPIQTHADAERRLSNQVQQPGDLHIVLRRNSNTPSSGTNTLEQNQQSLGRQPPCCPNKRKTTSLPQISVASEGGKDSGRRSMVSVQTTEDASALGMEVPPSSSQSMVDISAQSPTYQHSISEDTQATKHKGARGNRKRHRQRNPGHSSEPSGAQSSAQDTVTASSSPNHSHSVPSEIILNPSHSTRPRRVNPSMRPCYSQADIPTSTDLYSPPDPRRASSAGRLSSDNRSTAHSEHCPAEGEEAPSDSSTVDVRHAQSGDSARALSRLNRLRSDLTPFEEEEDAYRERLSQSSQQLRLFLRRETNEDEDMFV